MTINVYTKEFSAYGVFRFNEDELCWQIETFKVTDGQADWAEAQDALFEQLDRELELEANARDMGYF